MKWLRRLHQKTGTRLKYVFILLAFFCALGVDYYSGKESTLRSYSITQRLEHELDFSDIQYIDMKKSICIIGLAVFIGCAANVILRDDRKRKKK